MLIDSKIVEIKFYNDVFLVVKYFSVKVNKYLGIKFSTHFQNNKIYISTKF